MYSKHPKTGRPVFGFFEKRPVDKPPVIGLSSEIRTISSGFRAVRLFPIPTSGYRTSGSIASNRTSDSRNQYQNLFQTGSKPVYV